MKEQNNYGQLFNLWCQVYDPLEVELSFIRNIIGSPPNSILDVGAGTGRHAAPLIKYNYKVTTIEIDSRLNDIMKDTFLESGLNPKMFNTINEDFDTVRNIGNIETVLSSWTLCLLPNPIKALLKAYEILKESKDPTLILIEPWGKSDYANIVLPFLGTDTHKIDVNEQYLIPINKVFKDWEYHDYGIHQIPYVMNSLKQALLVFEFALNDWHGIKIDNKKQKELISILEKYRNSTEYIIFEEPRFIYLKRGKE